MNKHVSPDQMGVSPLVPSERVEALIDAITLYEMRRLRSLKHAQDISWGSCTEISNEDEFRLDQLVNEEGIAHLAVVANAKILMRDGILERCVNLLRTEATGDP